MNKKYLLQSLVGICVTSLIYILLMVNTTFMDDGFVHFIEIGLSALTSFLMCFYFAIFGHIRSGAIK